MDKKSKRYWALIYFFLIINVIFIAGKSMMDRWGIDRNVVLIGNLLMLLLTLGSYFLSERGLKNPNPHAFVRSVYSSVMLKLFVCMIAAFVYIFTWRSHLNKPALFICMGLYLVYTFIEVAVLMKLLKQKTNA